MLLSRNIPSVVCLLFLALLALCSAQSYRSPRNYGAISPLALGGALDRDDGRVYGGRGGRGDDYDLGRTGSRFGRGGQRGDYDDSEGPSGGGRYASGGRRGRGSRREGGRDFDDGEEYSGGRRRSAYRRGGRGGRYID